MLPGIYTGTVVDVVDPLRLKRVKVRVYGVFEEPIPVDHIPWASAVFSDSRIPDLGDVVYVFFKKGMWESPVYLAKSDYETDAGKTDRDSLFDEARNKVFNETNSKSVSAAGQSVEMSPCLEPEASSLPPEKDNSVVDKEFVSQTDGEGKGFIVYSDIIVRMDVDKLMAVFAKLLLQLQEVGIKADSKMVFQTGIFALEAGSSIKCRVGANEVEVSSSGVKITAPTINLNGTTVLRNSQAGGTPGFCSLPLCTFTGALHTVPSAGS